MVCLFSYTFIIFNRVCPLVEKTTFILNKVRTLYCYGCAVCTAAFLLLRLCINYLYYSKDIEIVEKMMINTTRRSDRCGDVEEEEAGTKKRER
jgi:hypothetical protein